MTDVVQVPLTQGLTAIIDAEDAERVLAHRWFAAGVKAGKPYGARVIRRADRTRAFRFLHHEVLGLEEPVDHVDGDGLNNRRCNLRPVDSFGNARNARPHPMGSCPYKGVSLATNGKWAARICAGYSHRQLGTFSDPIMAALAYDDAARELHGEFAWLNADHFEEVRDGKR